MLRGNSKGRTLRSRQCHCRQLASLTSWAWGGCWLAALLREPCDNPMNCPGVLLVAVLKDFGNPVLATVIQRRPVARKVWAIIPPR